MENLLNETALLNYNAPEIRSLIHKRNWRELSEKERILAIYNYVRDEIAFGYNKADTLSAADVLRDGYGQCNTKGTLFMALLRAVQIPCRIHGFFVDKIIQKGTLKGFYYGQSPKEILHSWVEVYYNAQWLNLEGFILDMRYLGGLQAQFKDCTGSFCGYAVATPDFQNPPVEWNGGNTYIQKDGIIADLGVFDSPDELFGKERQKVGRFKTFMFRYIVRHFMNRNVNRIRNKIIPSTKTHHSHS
ncbi:MAG: transglutaminase-like domain-containing protein [Oscillospiraceae bacterium]|nr:transglutaminase-like domain-containing protein [Oscillospiraceae bacterium]